MPKKSQDDWLYVGAESYDSHRYKVADARAEGSPLIRCSSRICLSAGQPGRQACRQDGGLAVRRPWSDDGFSEVAEQINVDGPASTAAVVHRGTKTAVTHNRRRRHFADGCSMGSKVGPSAIRVAAAWIGKYSRHWRRPYFG